MFSAGAEDSTMEGSSDCFPIAAAVNSYNKQPPPQQSHRGGPAATCDPLKTSVHSAPEKPERFPSSMEFSAVWKGDGDDDDFAGDDDNSNNNVDGPTPVHKYCFDDNKKFNAKPPERMVSAHFQYSINHDNSDRPSNSMSVDDNDDEEESDSNHHAPANERQETQTSSLCNAKVPARLGSSRFMFNNTDSGNVSASLEESDFLQNSSFMNDVSVSAFSKQRP
jgi:hypothetical protein